MFEMCKEILEKVSFDKSLFRKELNKSIRWIKKDELLALKVWCLSSFGHLYKDVISEAFDSMPMVWKWSSRSVEKNKKHLAFYELDIPL